MISSQSVSYDGLLSSQSASYDGLLSHVGASVVSLMYAHTHAHILEALPTVFCGLQYAERPGVLTF